MIRSLFCEPVLLRRIGIRKAILLAGEVSMQAGLAFSWGYEFQPTLLNKW